MWPMGLGLSSVAASVRSQNGRGIITDECCLTYVTQLPGTFAARRLSLASILVDKTVHYELVQANIEITMDKPQHTNTLGTSSTGSSQGKVSWVEFLRSIRFDQAKKSKASGECSSHFAAFDQRTPARGASAEDQFLVRSAN